MIMKDNSEIKESALAALKNNWSKPVLEFLELWVISCGIAWVASLFKVRNPSLADFVSIAGNIFLVAPIAYGIRLYILQFYRERNYSDASSQLSYVFSHYWRTMGIVLLKGIYIFLWTLLLIIPGIIKSYSYAMTYFISYDEPELSAEDCINKSMRMMEGHKFDLFLLDFSFIGWALLCLLTLGIGFLWLYPYVLTSHAVFYEELKEMEAEKMENLELEFE